jgi:hypothetical protein
VGGSAPAAVPIQNQDWTESRSDHIGPETELGGELNWVETLRTGADARYAGAGWILPLSAVDKSAL